MPGIIVFASSLIQACDYDVVRDGGAVGSYTMPIQLPDGAVVYQITVYVKTAFVSAGGGTISVGWGTVPAQLTALLASVGVGAGTDPWLKSAYSIQTGDPATTFSGTNNPVPGIQNIVVTVGTAPITAGKVVFIIEYCIPS